MSICNEVVGLFTFPVMYDMCGCMIGVKGDRPLKHLQSENIRSLKT